METPIITFRKLLHKYPELSGEENSTAKKILQYLNKTNPDKVIKNLGGEGLAFVYNNNSQGETIMFRCDMDALPIEETNSFEHKSVNKGISHKCGHDGHMAILARLAEKISTSHDSNKRVVLLFQPAEETGQGAEKIINDPAFKYIEPDHIFGFHNIPGYKKQHIEIKENTFAAASCGMEISFYGKTAHAAQPQDGVNPVFAIANIINDINDIQQKDFTDFILTTITHLKVGKYSFGTSAGKGILCITLRSYRNDDMNLLIKKIKEIIKLHTKKQGINTDIKYHETFLATENNSLCNAIVEKAAKINGFSINKSKIPFKWSEDFSIYTKEYKGCMFGIGAGINHSQLHTPDYDFPDDIIESSAELLFSIFKTTQK